METFPIVKHREVDKYRVFCNKSVNREIFNEILEFDKTGRGHTTRFDSPTVNSANSLRD